jgi:hypothetical protein
MKCPTCDGDLVRKNRAVLFIVGAAMMASLGASFFFLPLLLPAILSALTGIYLVHWSTVGRGFWCRTCKAYPVRGRAAGETARKQ